MADRNTTSTPYKLSADGICYFRYPDGDAPVVTVADYAELRTKGLGDAAAGGIIHIDDIAMPWRNGQVLWGVKTNDDDGGYEFDAADGGSWKRLSNEINIGWWADGEDFDYTGTLSLIGAESRYLKGDKLKVRVPHLLTRGELNRVNITAQKFYLLRDAGSQFTFSQSVDATVDDWCVVKVVGAEEMYTSPEITFYGHFNVNRYNRTGDNKGLVEISLAAGAQVELNHSTTYPIAGAMQLVGTGGDTASHVTIRGVHIGGGIDTTPPVNGIGLVTLDCELSDPEGQSLGINPSDETLNGTLDFFKGNGFGFNGVRRVEGKIFHKYGPQIFGATAGLIDGSGTEDEPFEMHCEDIGYNPQGLQWSTVTQGFGVQGVGKWDGMSYPATAKRYMRFRFTGKFSCPATLTLEATPDSAGDTKIVDDLSIEMIDQSSPRYTYDGFPYVAYSESGDPSDRGIIRAITLTGQFPSLKTLGGNDSGDNITILGYSRQRDFTLIAANTLSADGVYFPWEGPSTFKNVTIPAATLAETTKYPFIELADAGETLTFENFTIEGDAPLIGFMALGTTRADSFGITVNLINPSFPSGSTIVEVAGAVNSPVLQIDGITQTLPWTAP